jgi:hypothetical protein
MVALVAVLATVVVTIVVPEEQPLAPAFVAKLELKTRDTVAVESLINKALDKADLTMRTSSDAGKKVYALDGSREAITMLLTSLDGIWDSFDSTKSLVETKVAAEPVVVKDIDAIIKLMTPVMPDLTTGERESEKPMVRPAIERKLHLTIVLENSD